MNYISYMTRCNHLITHTSLYLAKPSNKRIFQSWIQYTVHSVSLCFRSFLMHFMLHINGRFRKRWPPFCLLFSLRIFERNSGNNFLSYIFYIAADVEFVAKEIIPRFPFEKPYEKQGIGRNGRHRFRILYEQMNRYFIF